MLAARYIHKAQAAYVYIEIERSNLTLVPQTNQKLNIEF